MVVGIELWFVGTVYEMRVDNNQWPLLTLLCSYTPGVMVCFLLRYLHGDRYGNSKRELFFFEECGDSWRWLCWSSESNSNKRPRSSSRHTVLHCTILLLYYIPCLSLFFFSSSKTDRCFFFFLSYLRGSRGYELVMREAEDWNERNGQTFLTTNTSRDLEREVEVWCLLLITSLFHIKLIRASRPSTAWLTNGMADL